MNYAAAPIARFVGEERGPDRIRSAIDGWTRSPPLAALVEAWDGQMLPSNTASRLAWLDEFSATHWDFRNGAERDAIGAGVDDDARREIAVAATHALGVWGESTPVYDEYSHVLVLGGLVRACLARPAHAAKLVSAGLGTSTVVGLGGFRQLSDAERELADEAGAPGLRDEMEAMDFGMRRAFDASPAGEQAGADAPDQRFSRWVVRHYDASDPQLLVVGAPSREPATRRANTADTFVFWAERVAHLTSSDRILLITTDIYVPFQGANAIRWLGLPYGAEVDTVGVDLSAIDPPLRQEFNMQQRLQEVRSTIRAYVDLWAAVSEGRR